MIEKDLHAGAAFPAKKITRGLTVSRSAGFIFFNNRYLYRAMSDISITQKENAYMYDAQDVQSLTLEKPCQKLRVRKEGSSLTIPCTREYAKRC